ncbi:SMC family ATPase [Arthrobacter livingstonensis]|uniref:Nuclease SbcCD subunit C n=1 Tax=Arthrobacter livingstonensis TaxID=670078 RepID=A0A2V5LDS8_9MICC|nr:SMC family ATPase [Arthrobacter livingstonensis]PYI68734.1 SMC family ATPase [Arthrobacter livingstonensis]
MRIHRLEIQAFGPFAGRETVDFDALGAQGLFLLNGATGAGKTSVLDAVAYSLYGQIPGARRNTLKNLRSHHAAEGDGPEVVCEFSAGGRRLEVRRSPEWMRPAKRGTGTTREQASTQLREFVDGEWVALSQRNDEAASEIQRLLGMNMEQFTKVILLAQGEFAAFLRASAKDREELLEKLFGTEIYQGLEARLTADAREAGAAVQSGLAQLAAHEALARSQAAAVLESAGFPAEPDGDMEADAAGAGGAGQAGDGSGRLPVADRSGGLPVADGANAVAKGEAGSLESSGAELFAWLSESLGAAVQRASDDVAANELLATEAAGAVAAAEQRQARHALRDAALAEQARVAAMASEAARWDGALTSHHEAQVLAAVVAAAADTSQAHDAAKTAAGRAGAAFAANGLAAGLAESLHGAGAGAGAGDGTAEAESWPSLPLLAAVETELAGQLAVVAAAIPVEQRLARAAVDLAKGEKALAAATRDVAAQQDAETRGRTRLVEVKTGLATLREDAVPVQHATDHHEAASRLVVSIGQHADQSAVVERLAAKDLAVRENAVAAKQAWLDAVELRHSLAAGELAALLVDGEPCQVCGSTVHPSPSELAGSGAEAVQAERKAKAASQAAEKLAADSHAVLSEARQLLAVLAERGGDGVAAEAEAAVVHARNALESAVAAAARLEALSGEAESVETGVARAQTALLAASRQVASLTAGNAALAQEAGQLERDLAAARAGHASLAGRQKAVDAARHATSALMNARRQQDSAAAAGSAAASALSVALADSAFADAAQVRDALLDKSEAAAMAEQLAAFKRAGTLNAAQLERAEIAEAAQEAAQGVRAPDEADLAEYRDEARRRGAAAQAAGVRLGLARKAGEQVAQTAAAFESREALVAPLRERAALLAGLAEAVRGAGDNQLKMTLTSYVLAARLEQVAMAASVRLSTMSGQRYTLSHTDAKAGGNRKSGLGLEVVDEWTQRSRDTSTLSGGESFMASLALALGLADVVQQESGGLDIETLFVDEGFGSLDEESLDQVMDALEGLRDGGRVVGLVSHVAEMKTRIPVHLQVTKGRAGSTLTLESV